MIVAVVFAALAMGWCATRPSVEQRADALRQRLLAGVQDEQARGEVAAALRRKNPEWDLMHRTFLALALVDRALAHPDDADELLPQIDALVQSQIEEQRRFGDRHFLLPYGHRGGFADPSGASVFVDGEIALVLGARRFVRDDASVAEQHRARVAAIAAQIERSPSLLAESYPGEAWLFCNTNALVAIRMADVLDGSDHRGLIARWVAHARASLIDASSGLLGSEFTWHGAPLDGPEGSSLWLVAANLRLLDDTLAQQQYARAKQVLLGNLLGLGYAREWPADAHGTLDVDSGPIVPLVGASASSSGFALLAARLFDDQPTLDALTRSLGAADLVLALDPALAAMADNAMGDAVLAYALGAGPLWRRIGTVALAPPDNL